jgi:hypothetical protein
LDAYDLSQLILHKNTFQGKECTVKVRIEDKVYTPSIASFTSDKELVLHFEVNLEEFKKNDKLVATTFKCETCDKMPEKWTRCTECRKVVCNNCEISTIAGFFSSTKCVSCIEEMIEELQEKVEKVKGK